MFKILFQWYKDLSLPRQLAMAYFAYCVYFFLFSIIMDSLRPLIMGDAPQGVRHSLFMALSVGFWITLVLQWRNIKSLFPGRGVKHTRP